MLGTIVIKTDLVINTGVDFLYDYVCQEAGWLESNIVNALNRLRLEPLENNIGIKMEETRCLDYVIFLKSHEYLYLLLVGSAALPDLCS